MFSVSGGAKRAMVGPGRVERPTSRLSGVRSNHLSYEPVSGKRNSEVRDQKVVTLAQALQTRSRAEADPEAVLIPDFCILTSDSTEGRETKGAV
jgi:hypothetical protein